MRWSLTIQKNLPTSKHQCLLDISKRSPLKYYQNEILSHHGDCYLLRNDVLHVVELATWLENPFHLIQCPSNKTILALQRKELSSNEKKAFGWFHDLGTEAGRRGQGGVAIKNWKMLKKETSHLIWSSTVQRTRVMTTASTDSSATPASRRSSPTPCSLK